MNNLDKVKQFHQAFGLPVEPNTTMLDWKRFNLRYDLIEEELYELSESWADKDMVEILDALVDIQYVLLGTVLEFGLQEVFQEAFDEVHRSNMSKLGAAGEPIYRNDGKVLKGENYTPPNLEKILNKT